MSRFYFIFLSVIVVVGIRKSPFVKNKLLGINQLLRFVDTLVLIMHKNHLQLFHFSNFFLLLPDRLFDHFVKTGVHWRTLGVPHGFYATKCHASLSQWIRTSIYLCLEGKINHICRHPCGRRTILRSKFITNNHNEETLAENPQSWGKKITIIVIIGINVGITCKCQQQPTCCQVRPQMPTRNKKSTQLHRKVALSKSFWNSCEVPKSRVSQ